LRLCAATFALGTRMLPYDLLLALAKADQQGRPVGQSLDADGLDQFFALL
jgi:hypothetical protein